MLEGYDGPCREIHGHSYRLFVTVKGIPECNNSSPKYGMVLDFGLLKRAVNEQIVERLDHAFMMRDTVIAHTIVKQLEGRFTKIVLTPYQPTCENMLGDFAERLKSVLPEGVELHSLRLHETATSFAEWFAEDNA